MIKKLVIAWGVAGLINYYGQLIYIYFRLSAEQYPTIRAQLFGSMSLFEMLKHYTPLDRYGIANIKDSLNLVAGFKTFRAFRKAYM